MAQGKWQFWIDRGGTFTDIAARDPAGCLSTHTPLSDNPARYRDTALAGIKTILQIPLDTPIPPGTIGAVKMGTTVATNALLVASWNFADLPARETAVAGVCLSWGNLTCSRLLDLTA